LGARTRRTSGSCCSVSPARMLSGQLMKPIWRIGVKRKRGRFNKTAPAEQNEKGSLCSVQFTLLIGLVRLAFQFADLLLELFDDFLADFFRDILILVDIATRFAQTFDGFDAGDLRLPLAAHDEADT